MKIKETDLWDKWIAKNQETCLFCAEPLMKKNFRDAVKDHCHIMGKFLRSRAQRLQQEIANKP